MSPVYSKNTSYLLCVCKEQGSFSLCEQDFKQDYMYYAPEGCPRGTHTDRTAYTRLYQDDWSLAHYNPHLFPRCAAYKARYARAPLRGAKQGCPHRPQGAKRACPVEKSAPRLTISRRTRRTQLLRVVTFRGGIADDPQVDNTSNLLWRVANGPKEPP